MSDGLGDGAPELVDVLALDGEDLEAVALESLRELEALEVLGGMARDGDVVVVDEELDVQVLCDGEAGGLGVVALLLGAVGAEAEDGLVAVGEGDAVDEGPDVAEAAGGELDARGEAELGVTWKLRVGGAVVEEVFGGDVALEGGEEVLGRDAVTWRARCLWRCAARGTTRDVPASSKTTG